MIYPIDLGRNGLCRRHLQRHQRFPWRGQGKGREGGEELHHNSRLKLARCYPIAEALVSIAGSRHIAGEYYPTLPCPTYNCFGSPAVSKKKNTKHGTVMQSQCRLEQIVEFLFCLHIAPTDHPEAGNWSLQGGPKFCRRFESCRLFQISNGCLCID